MLVSLFIENFAIVSHLELDFTKGMTAFTGETGAGKSIMIDALMLALGARADTNVIRPGAEKCDITACFSFGKHSKPHQWLNDNDLAAEDNYIFLRRVFYTNKPSKAYINGHMHPLQKVKELSAMLVDVHGQHQQHSLLQHSTHRKQLDRFSGHDTLLQHVMTCFDEYHEVKMAIDELTQKDAPHDKIALLQYQLEELHQLELGSDEITHLNDEHALLHHARDYVSTIYELTESIQGESNQAIVDNLNHCLQLLATLPEGHNEVQSAQELLNNALIEVEEAANELQQFTQKIPLDESRLADIESRLSLLHHTARKYQVDVRLLPDKIQDLENSLLALQSEQNRKDALEKQLIVKKSQYDEAALELRTSRQLHAKKLSQKITQLIQQLGMPKGFITIEFLPLEKPQKHGLDIVQYKVCTNPGMSLEELGKVASGGELSRISLAIQMITAEQASTPTLLFDEVDVGIGGATAALVGQMLRRLSACLQVFCVTHQPQVAACAHQHYIVKKELKNNETFSSIIALNTKAQTEEIARMLGGLTITEQTRSHAVELIKKSVEA